MFTINYEISINRSPEETFRYVSDSRNDATWCPPVLEVNQVKGSSPELRAKYTFITKPGPKKTEGAFEIVDFKPNIRAAYKGENGIAHFNYHYEFSSGDNATKLRMTSTVAPKGLWKLLQPVMRSATKKVTKEEFDNLKRLLEDQQHGNA
mgnify:FL=1